MTKSLDKMTKAQLIDVIAVKDKELALLRDRASRATSGIDVRSSLMVRAAELSRETRVMHRVHAGHVERYEGQGRWACVS